MIVFSIASFSFLIGFLLLILPLSLPELSRPKDSFFGALILLFGVLLSTSSESFYGASAFGFFCQSVIISRLGCEVFQGRWLKLSQEEKKRMASLERWRTSSFQIFASVLRLVTGSSDLLKTFFFKPRKPVNSGKKWVRPENQQDKKDLKDNGLSTEDINTQPNLNVVVEQDE